MERVWEALLPRRRSSEGGEAWVDLFASMFDKELQDMLVLGLFITRGLEAKAFKMVCRGIQSVDRALVDPGRLSDCCCKERIDEGDSDQARVSSCDPGLRESSAVPLDGGSRRCSSVFRA